MYPNYFTKRQTLPSLRLNDSLDSSRRVTLSTFVVGVSLAHWGSAFNWRGITEFLAELICRNSVLLAITVVPFSRLRNPSQLLLDARNVHQYYIIIRRCSCIERDCSAAYIHSIRCSFRTNESILKFYCLTSFLFSAAFMVMILRANYSIFIIFGVMLKS